MKIFRNNKIAKTLILYSFIGISLFSGCKKFVEIDGPRNSLTSDKVFSSNEQANGVLAGLYSSFNTSISFYAGMSGDELMNLVVVNGTLKNPFVTGTLQVDDSNVGSIWASHYKTIYIANSIIEGVEASSSATLTDSVRRQLVGEAKFVRAWSYFYLTNLFGDVPLVLTTDFNKTALLHREAQANVFAQMERDLIEAKSLLPQDYSVSRGERIRPNSAAAAALLARTYLYTKKWSEAEAQAGLVISNNQFSLQIPLPTVFLKNSREAIWQFLPNSAVSPFGIAESANFLPFQFYSELAPADQAVFMQYYSIVGNLLKPSYGFTPELTAAFETGDLRKKLWAEYTPTPNVAPYTGETLYFPHKYPQRLAANNVQTHYYMMLRIAEQYLIRAEARANQGKLSGGFEDLNAIRVRAGLLPITVGSQEDLFMAIARERRVELFSEWGHRFFDLKRTGKAQEVLGTAPLKQPWNNSQLLYPIPPLEIANDPNLVQNPGY